MKRNTSSKQDSMFDAVTTSSNEASEVSQSSHASDDSSSSSSSEESSSSSSGAEDSEIDDTLPPMNNDVELGLPSNIPRASQVKNRRLSNCTDLATGKQGGRTHHASIRSETSEKACTPNKRLMHNLKHLVKRPSQRKLNTRTKKEDELKTSFHGRLMVSTRGLGPRTDSGHVAAPQYRLKALAPTTRAQQFLQRIGLTSLVYDNEESTASSYAIYNLCCFWLSPNDLVRRYLRWTFRSSLPPVIMSAAVGYFFLVTLFAVGIWDVGKRHPSCVGGVYPNEYYFTDAFQLSWTTFATVGYGIVHSGISQTEPDIRKCTGITILVSLEAFIGVLFASMCCAVMFAKVSRYQSYAQVIFSDAMVIQYGSGLNETGVENEEDPIPCPVLDFRVINLLNQTQGGELIDAAVNVVAIIDAKQACPSLRQATARRRRGKKGKKALLLKRRSLPNIGPGVPMLQGTSKIAPQPKRPTPEHRDSISSLRSIMRPNKSTNTHQAFEEDPSGYLVPKRIFSRLEIESPYHPFFKRVWMFRHILDENSPLLKSHARKLVIENGGYWPRELNNHEGVRSAVLFDQILISLTGTSNADANAVYGQKILHFADMHVGYRFANVLFRDGDGKLGVNPSLINDVTEQEGGGGEPLSNLRGGPTELTIL